MMRVRYPLLLALAAVASACADTVELKTGERIECSFKQASPVNTVIDVAGQSVTIPTEKIKAIHFGMTANPDSALQRRSTRSRR